VATDLAAEQDLEVEVLVEKCWWSQPTCSQGGDGHRSMGSNDVEGSGGV
jgi:hypothetical protein